MAIKGKGRTKTRQPVRAPRREPVPVPVPFAKRRGVQALAAFIAGLLVFWGGIWLTNGLREQDQTTESAQQELLRRRAGAAWKSFIETQVGTIGTVTEGSPPVVLPQVSAVLTGLGERTPEDAVSTLQGAAADAKEVSEAIASYDLSGSTHRQGVRQGRGVAVPLGQGRDRHVALAHAGGGAPRGRRGASRRRRSSRRHRPRADAPRRSRTPRWRGSRRTRTKR